jgi:hypothetical protein
MLLVLTASNPSSQKTKKTFAPNKKPFLLLDAPATTKKEEQQPGAGLEATGDFIFTSND